MTESDYLDTKNSKPGFFYAVITIALMVYTGTIAAFSLVAILYKSSLMQIIIAQSPFENYSETVLFIGIIIVCLLHFSAFFGLLLLWKMRKWGFFIFSFSMICASILPVFYGIDPSLSGLLFLVLISYYAFSFKTYS